MKFKGDLDKLRRAALKRGWVVEQTNGDHVRWTYGPTGDFFFSSLSPSCVYAKKKIEKQIRNIENDKLQTNASRYNKA